MGYGCDYASTRALEVYLATLMLVCGVALVTPGDTFALQHYTLVREYISERTGGFIFIGTGIIRLAALGVNGQVRQSPIPRLVGCLVGAGFWLTMAVAMEEWYRHHVEIIPLMLSVASVNFAFEFYSALRCGSDASYLNSFGQRKHGKL